MELLQPFGSHNENQKTFLSEIENSMWTQDTNHLTKNNPAHLMSAGPY